MPRLSQLHRCQGNLRKKTVDLHLHLDWPLEVMIGLDWKTCEMTETPLPMGCTPIIQKQCLISSNEDSENLQDLQQGPRDMTNFLA